jgi:adenylate kinase
MNERCVLAVTGTPGVGKSALSAWLDDQGWGVLSVAELAASHGCLGERDPMDGAAPVDIRGLDEAWDVPQTGRWVVDGHLSHFLDVDGVIVLRCAPPILSERLALRGYDEAKVRANVEWEMMAGHWAELSEFEVEVPLLELDAGVADVEALGREVEAWVSDGMPWDGLENHLASVIDWLAESAD